ncbi:MAG: hypothetical protein R2726_09450 [Acidimicrobiales bacterium]
MAGAASTAVAGTPTASFLRRHAALLGGAVVAAPLVVAAVRMLTIDGYAPYADLPLIELAVRDVGLHPVLVGAYSRFGWFHPGPLMFYVLAVPYRLLGSQAVSLPAAAALVNAAGVVVVAWLARRRAGLGGLVLVLAGTAIVLRTIGAELWVDAWNPSVAVIPFLVFVLACWGVSAGDDLCLVVAVVAGSASLQSHAGYLPLVGLVGALAVASRVASGVGRRRRGEHGSEPPPAPPGGGRTMRLRTAVAVAIGLGVVLWLPPLIEQATHDPGNLRQIVGFSRDVRPQTTLADGGRFVAFELGVPPAWVAGELEPGWLGLVDVSAPPVPVGALLLVAAGGVAAWRREVDALRLVVLAAGAALAAVVAVSRFADGIYPYLTQWSPVVGLVVWLAIGWTAWRVARPLLPDPARLAAGAVAAAVVVVVTMVNVVAGATAAPHDLDRSAPILALSDAVEPRLDRAQPVVVDLAVPSGGVEALWTARGMVDELDRRGFDVRVPVGDADLGRRADPSGATQLVAVRRLADDVPPDWRGSPPLSRSGDLAVWVAPYGR